MLALSNTGSASDIGVHSFQVAAINGDKKSLSAYKGKVLLIVNTASRCGYTPQYKSLESLYGRYKAQGFEVLGFPANNFLGQEPGTNEEIKEFCSLKYNVTFPMFSKISVKGKDIDPLYQYLTKESGFNGDIPWNFSKFLVGPDGKVVARFDPKAEPLSDEIVQKIESVLPKN
jgi:glutathione peroxidase